MFFEAGRQGPGTFRGTGFHGIIKFKIVRNRFFPGSTNENDLCGNSQSPQGGGLIFLLAMMLDDIPRHLVTLFLIILVSVMLWKQKNRDAERKYFWLTVISCLILMLEDELEAYTAGDPSLRFWRILLSSIGFTFRSVAPMGLALVAVPKEKRKPALMIPCLVTLAVCCTAFFTDIAFGFDEDYAFYRGPLGYVAFVVPYFYLLVILVNAYRRFAEVKGVQKYLIPGCALFCVAASLSDVLHGGIRVNEAIMISSVFFYLILSFYDNRRDPLTGMLNRQAFYSDCAVYDNEITAVASLDMNGLKEMNDTYGHAAGDEALVRIAACLRSAEGRDLATYRIGGDEFVLLFFRAKNQAVAEAAERIRDRITEAGYSVSVGYTSREDGRDLEETIRESDSRMYADKAEYYRQSGIDRRKKNHIYGAGQ